MSNWLQYINSSIGSKKLIGITGLGLCGFLLMHMAGNMLILVSPEKYNLYSHNLITNPFLEVIELILLGLFALHVIKAITINIRNRFAREVANKIAATGDKKTTIVSKTLVQQGLVVFIFVVLHLLTFKYGTVYKATYNGIEVRDLHRLVIEVFHQPLYVLWYVFALGVLAMHLGHGFYSSLQSLGLNHIKYTGLLKGAGVLYDVTVIGGFLSQPIYVFFFHQG